MHKGRLNIVNRDEYPLFVPSPVERYRMNSRITSVRLERFSQDERYKVLKEQGLTFDIDNPEIYVNGKKPITGIFSSHYGADSTQDTPIYSCDCHRLTGAVNRGRWCEQCESYVRTVDADLRSTLYIDFSPYHLLTYHGYNAMSKIFKNLDEIISTTQRIDKSGKAIDNGLPTIMDLYDDYDELYAAKTGLPKEVAWMSHVPCYSSRLRPLVEKDPSSRRISMLEVNRLFLSLVRLENVIKSTLLMPTFRRDIEIQRTLNQAQQDYNGIVAEVITQINGKTGVFRRAMAAGRLDSSSRLVIALGPDLMANEIDLPYSVMMIQYEEEIAQHLSKMRDISINKAIALIDQHVTDRDDYFVKIINQLLKSGRGIWALVNRNPTISESGVEYARIRKIHDDPTDITMHLPPDPLPLFAADFDGDQCTVASVKNPKFHKYFLPMTATYAYIDRADGRFNRAMAPKREFSAILAGAYDTDQVLSQHLANPDADTYEDLQAMGIAEPDYDHRAEYESILENLWNAPRTKFRDQFFDPFM